MRVCVRRRTAAARQEAMQALYFDFIGFREGESVMMVEPGVLLLVRSAAAAVPLSLLLLLSAIVCPLDSVACLGGGYCGAGCAFGDVSRPECLIGSRACARSCTVCR